MRKATKFEHGYICACAALYGIEGGMDTRVSELLGCIGAIKINPETIDASDRPMLLEYQKMKAEREGA